MLSGAVNETEAGEVGWVETEGGTKMCVRELGRECKNSVFGKREKLDASERDPEEPRGNDLGKGGYELKSCLERTGPPTKIHPHFAFKFFYYHRINAKVWLLA